MRADAMFLTCVALFKTTLASESYVSTWLSIEKCQSPDLPYAKNSPVNAHVELFNSSNGASRLRGYVKVNEELRDELHHASAAYGAETPHGISWIIDFKHLKCESIIVKTVLKAIGIPYSKKCRLRAGHYDISKVDINKIEHAFHGNMARKYGVYVGVLSFNTETHTMTCWKARIKVQPAKSWSARVPSAANGISTEEKIKSKTSELTLVSSVMELASFVVSYFAAKRLTLLTAFLCWRPEEVSVLWRDTQQHSMRLRVANWAKLPPLEPYDTHREGILLDVTCPGAQLVLQKASSTRAFNLRHTWVLLRDATFNETLVESLLDSTLVLPDSDVVWAASDQLLDVYRIKADEPLVITPLGDDAAQGLLPAAPTRRRNLNNVYLKASTIISQPQHFKGWSDLTMRHIDTFPKLTYPLMLLLAEDLNFRYNLKQVDLYGENRNGSFNGLAGQLQRQEIEIGITSMFLRADRIQVLHFSSETVELRGSFIFRQPSKSSVSNVFLLPFTRGVWAATAAVLSLAAVMLTLLARRPQLQAVDPALEHLSTGETLIFTVGTVCQQGFEFVPRLASARMVMFFTLMTALFAFTAYSAKIVVILQTPSGAIRTIDDLTNSPFTMGVQETTYKRVYFAESTQPATQRLYQRKLLPLGEKAYLSVVDGVARLRTSLFAFQVEEPSGYDIISKTFTEREKCGLKQIQAFKLPMVAVPVRKHSGYKELFATRLRWQRETGLMERSRRMWLAVKPRCDAASGGFVSVGILDVLPAIHVLIVGMAASVLFFAIEWTMSRLRSKASQRAIVESTIL